MSEANAPNEHPSPQESPTAQPPVTVTTLPFALTPEVYFRILLRNIYCKYWWLFVLMVVCALGNFAIFCLDGFRFGVSFCICLFFLIWIFSYWLKCRKIAWHPSNKPIMKTRVFTLSKDKVTVNESESESVGNFTRENIFAVEKCGDYFLIWVTHLQMLYLPKTAFSTPEDLEAFESKVLPAYAPLKHSLKAGIVYLIAIFVAIVICFWIGSTL